MSVEGEPLLSQHINTVIVIFALDENIIDKVSNFDLLWIKFDLFCFRIVKMLPDIEEFKDIIEIVYNFGSSLDKV